MQSETCNPNVYSVYNNVYNDFSYQLLQHNAYSCSCPRTGCKQTCTHLCKKVLKLNGGECEQFCDAVYCTRTSDTVTCGDKCVWCSPSNSYRSNFISSAPSTASQGLATQFSTVQRKDNSHTWCE